MTNEEIDILLEAIRIKDKSKLKEFYLKDTLNKDRESSNNVDSNELLHYLQKIFMTMKGQQRWYCNRMILKDKQLDEAVFGVILPMEERENVLRDMYIQISSILAFGSIEQEEKERMMDLLKLIPDRVKVFYIDNQYVESPDLLISLESDEEKIKYLEQHPDDHYAIVSLKDENQRVQYALKLTYSIGVLEVAKTLSTDENRLKLIRRIAAILLEGEDHYYSLADSIILLEDDDTKMECMKLLSQDDSTYEERCASIIASLKDDAKKKKLMEKFSLPGKTIITASLQGEENDDFKINFFFNESSKGYFDIDILTSIYDDYKKAQQIDKIDDDFKKQIVKSIKKENISALEESIKHLDKELLNEFRKAGLYSTEFIASHVEQFMKGEGVEKNRLTSKIEIFNRLYNNYDSQESIARNINFNFLEEEFIEILGEERVAIMANYPETQKMFIEMCQDSKKKEVFNKCFNRIIEQYVDESWRQIAEGIMIKLTSGEYDKLLESMQNINEIDFVYLYKTFINDNLFNIQTVEQLANYEQIKRRVCNGIMQDDEDILTQYPIIASMSNIERKQLAVLEKLYGQDLKSAIELVEKYGEGINNLSITDEKTAKCIAYINSLKAILNTQDEMLLNKFYEIQGLNEKDINPIAIEYELRSAFAREYNKGLFDVKDAKDFDEVDGVKFYEAGTEFKMIISSIGAYYTEEDKVNFQKDWNRKDLQSHAMCTSYIRNDMIGTAPIPHFCYGFTNMEEKSLVLASPENMYSRTNQFTIVPENAEKYYTPDAMISQTEHKKVGRYYNTVDAKYNELVYNRIQEGSRKQPSYIVVFRENGIIYNLEEVLKASKDWNGTLPIVVIDKNECARAEQRKINEMMTRYKQTGDKEILKNIFYICRNNDANPYFNINELYWELREQIEQMSEEETKQREKDTKTLNHISGKQTQKVNQRVVEISNTLLKIIDDGEER